MDKGIIVKIIITIKIPERTISTKIKDTMTRDMVVGMYRRAKNLFKQFLRGSLPNRTLVLSIINPRTNTDTDIIPTHNVTLATK
jgi:hypothetical protein